jgi:predicted Rossmann fold flavoprotein
LFCAAECGKRGKSVLIVEHNDSPGKKILISGGGKCNFTNINASHTNYISQNPSFCKSPLSRFTPQDFIKLLESRRIEYFEKKDGQLFCSKGSKQILNLLLEERANNNVEILYNTEIENVEYDGDYKLAFSGGESRCKSLIIASGGLSIPKIGAGPFGFEIARKFGLNIIAPRPGLTPLLYNQRDAVVFSGLSGISVNVETRIKKIRFRENLLFTHTGLSGPAVLQISSYREETAPVIIDFLPGTDFQKAITERRNEKILLKTFLSSFLPARFAEVIAESFFNNKFLNNMSNKDINRLVEFVKNYNFIPSSSAGFEKAEVTVGGVDTKELSSKTMEAVKQPGLYFIGEVVDVTGQLGGYNFQWAWASAFAAGQFA